MKVVLVSLSLLGGLILSSCQGDERIAEVRNLELQEELQMKTEQADKAERALAERHRFLQGVAGTFEGVVTGKSGEQRIQLTLVPNSYPVEVDRVRATEVIDAEINELSIGVQVAVSSVDASIARVGCEILGIKPNWVAGQIEIPASPECANYFLIQIDDSAVPTNVRLGDVRGNSRTLSSNIRSGQIQQVNVLNGYYRPTATGEIRRFSVERVSQ